MIAISARTVDKQRFFTFACEVWIAGRRADDDALDWYLGMAKVATVELWDALQRAPLPRCPMTHTRPRSPVLASKRLVYLCRMPSLHCQRSS
jgi:hypothetical protein